MTKYLVEFENHLYPFTRLDLLKIALCKNARDGIVPSAIYQEVPDGLGYRFDPVDPDSLLKPEVELPVQIVEGVAA